MDDKIVNLRLHYEGKFKKTSYVGGKHFIVMSLDVESFSYSVLMELVKDNLHFTEIEGIYVNKGRKVNFYIDNIIDKQIETTPQMQPHVITRPRENFIQASPEKPLKRKFVYHTSTPAAKKRKWIKSYPRTIGDIEDTGHKDVAEKLPPPPLSEYIKFKKAGCRGDSEDTRIDVAEKLPPPPPLCEYEKLKLDKIRANYEVYKSLGLPHVAE
ncbi:hypothetical protein AgCh_001289 [Apium graveolens]